MDYAGYYINLDRSPERRTQIEDELRRYNLTHLYERFPAVDGSTLKISSPDMPPGVVGCWLSHMLLLKKNIDSGRHLHVIEDDAVFANCTEQVIRWVMDTGRLDSYDIVFTDVSVSPLNDVYKLYKALYDQSVEFDTNGNLLQAKFQIIDISKIASASTMLSFLVNKESVQKVHDVLEKEMQQGISTPIDIFLRKKNFDGSLKIGCVFPFVTSMRLESSVVSEIDPRAARQSEVAAALGRYAFFIGCDRDLCRTYLEKYILPLIPDDWLTSLLGNVMTYSITDKFRFF